MRSFSSLLLTSAVLHWGWTGCTTLSVGKRTFIQWGSEVKWAWFDFKHRAMFPINHSVVISINWNVLIGKTIAVDRKGVRLYTDQFNKQEFLMCYKAVASQLLGQLAVWSTANKWDHTRIFFICLFLICEQRLCSLKWGTTHFF